MIYTLNGSSLDTSTATKEQIDLFLVELASDNGELWKELKDMVAPFFPDGKGEKFKVTKREIIRVIGVILRDYLVSRAAIVRKDKEIMRLKEEAMYSRTLFEITPGMRR